MEELEQVTAFQESQLEKIDVRQMGERIQTDILARRRSALAGRGVDERNLSAAMADMESSHAEVNFTDVARNALDENIFERALAAIEEDFSDRPKIKARLLQTLADTMRSLGLLERAAAPQRQALAIRRAELGLEHPDTLYSINSLANLLQTQGDLAAAEQLLREALEMRRRVLGEEHPHTLATTSVHCCVNRAATGMRWHSFPRLSFRRFGF